MKITFTDSAYKDYLYWGKKDSKKFIRIQTLLKDIKSNSYVGIGKPEPLKHDLKGFWSRRIDKQHRLVYKVRKEDILVISCRFHY